jgi:protein involved in polysaccharide export with SLBB domain/Mrp family chromosome partitioning ATPase
MAAQREHDLHETLRMSWASLRRYKVMMALIVAAALAGAAAYLALRPPAFTASARVLVDNRVLAIAQQDAVYSTSVLTPQLVQSQVEVLRSENLARRVIDSLDLKATPDFSEALTESAGLSPQQIERKALDIFRKRLTVEVVAQSHVIEVRYTAREPQRAADVVTALLNAYFEDQSTANAASAQAASGWLRNSMRSLGASARILASAMPPAGRDGPAAPLVLAFAAFSGIVSAITAALVRGFLDVRVRTPRDIARAVGALPVNVVPLIAHRKRARPLLTHALHASKSNFAHAISHVLSATRPHAETAGAVTVGITGVTANCGVSLISANVARVAAKRGLRVLLVDASRFSGTLTELARDGDRPSDRLLVDTWSGLRFASLLQAPLTAEGIARLLSSQRDAFDLIVVDLPPLDPVSDARDIAPLLDRILLVVAAGETTVDALRDAVETPALAEKIDAVVLNKVPASAAPQAPSFYLDERLTVAVPPLMFAPATNGAALNVDGHEPHARGTLDGAIHKRPPSDGGGSLHSSLTALVFAVFVAAMSGLFSPAHGEDYRLSSGDKVRIKVSEWPDLTGEYTLGDGKALSLPVIGDVEARDRTVPELAASIASALKSRADLPTAPAASVAIVSYRPFFVMGDVQRPGDYPYRPGLTVMQAVSIAGGYYRPVDATFRLERDVITARSEIAKERHMAKRVAARIARLEAEQADVDTIAPPADFDVTDGASDRILLDEEQAILKANKEALQKLLASLDHYKDLYEQEIVTITAQIATEKQQADSVQRELDSLKGLAERGLSPLTRQLSTERILAQVSGTIQGLQATILRARQNIGLTEQRRIEALNARTTRITEGLQKARADEKDAGQRLRAARDLLEEAQVIAPRLQASARLTGAVPSFSGMRAEPSGSTHIALDAAAEIRPGDVLTVERQLQSAGVQQSQRGNGDRPAAADHAQADR